MQRLATQVSIAIQQSELYEQTQRELLERERIRKILEESEQRLQSILDHAPAAIYLIDLQNQHLLVNHQYAELCQTEPQQLLGKSIYEVWPASIADSFAINNRTVITTGKLLKIEENLPHSNGQPRTYISVKFPLRDTTGTLYAICGISTDITEQKQLEAQFYRAQRLESLGTLASGIAHDLNNIFTPILACSQLVRIKHPDLETRSLEMLQLVEDSAKRGANMIKQILTFARGTGGDRRPVLVLPLLQEVLSVVQQTFPRGISIQTQIPDHAPWTIVADPIHLHQVFMNLCVNARDAMPNGGILSLSLDTAQVDHTYTHPNAQVAPYVVVTVADTGTGIPPAIRDRIFDPFFTTKPQEQGTGLGLATVLGIVRDYGGFVQVHSEEGQGSQFQVYLPIATQPPTDAPPPPSPFIGNGAQVLLVDDDPSVLTSIQAWLESHHYQVLTANRGKDAIVLYQQHQTEISVVVLDIMMPKMSGFTLIKRLRSIDPTIKIVAMSGLPTNREPALAAGATAFLQKPYSLDTLLQTLQPLVANPH